MLRLEKFVHSFNGFENPRKMTPTSTPSCLSGEDLSELKRYVLEASRKLLVENVDAPRFLPYFRSRFVLDQRECDQIKSCSRQSRYDGAEKLLDTLLTKGSHGYDHFCNAIMYDRTQMFLLTALNKRLELLRDWRRNQVQGEQQLAHAQAEMQLRIQQQINRQHVYTNKTYPMMTLSSSRYQPQPATTRLPTYQHHPSNPTPPAQERLARSPIPPDVEAMPQSGHFPNQQLHHSNYPEMHQLPQQPYPGMLPVHQVIQETHVAHPDVQHSHLAQPVLQHPHLIHQHAPPIHGGGYSYGNEYPPLPGQYVPPPAPVGVNYPPTMEGGAYHNHFSGYDDPLTLNTPSGARVEHLFPGPPPPTPNTTAQPSQTCHEAREVKPDKALNSPQQSPGSPVPPEHTSCDTGTGEECATDDILRGQGGN